MGVVQYIAIMIGEHKLILNVVLARVANLWIRNRSSAVLVILTSIDGSS